MIKMEDARLGPAAVVAVTGRLDAEAAPLFEAHCGNLLSAGETVFVLDLEDVDYLSSAGLRSILSLAKKLQKQNGKVVMAGVKGAVKEIFDISGFSTLFLMSDSLENAAKHVL